MSDIQDESASSGNSSSSFPEQDSPGLLRDDYGTGLSQPLTPVSFAPLPDPLIQEDLSLAYVAAVTAKAGLDYVCTRRDHGVDVVFTSLFWKETTSGRYRRWPGPVKLDCQLKSTKNFEIHSAHVKYDLDADTYNYIVHRNNQGYAPCILVLYCMPNDKTMWIAHDETSLSLRHCCYWYRPRGIETDKTSTTRIEIPISQTFTPLSLLELMHSAEVSLRGGVV